MHFNSIIFVSMMSHTKYSPRNAFVLTFQMFKILPQKSMLPHLNFHVHARDKKRLSKEAVPATTNSETRTRIHEYYTKHYVYLYYVGKHK